MHGGDIYRNKIEYDFSVNVNPLGLPEACQTALMRVPGVCSVYPDCEGSELVEILAKRLGVSPENIVISNGAAELIYHLAAVIRLENGEGFRALTPAPTFTEYEAAVTAFGGCMDYYMADERDGFILREDILKFITKDHKLVFICNPNNPTGRCADKGLMLRIAKKCAEVGAILVADECFVQFTENEAGISLVPEIFENKNIIVLQAFTKTYAMAGLRLGYGVTSDRRLIDKISAISQPWETSGVAQLLGKLALTDDAYLAKTKTNTRLEREYLMEQMRSLKVERIFDSEANFIMFKADETLYHRLYARGIMIRCLEDMKGLGKEYYRIGIRSHRDNQELIKRWKNIISDLK